MKTKIVALLIFTTSAFGQSTPPLQIQELDGSPSGVATKLRFSNSSVTQNGTIFDVVTGNVTDRLTSTNSTLVLTDNAFDQTLTGNLGDLYLRPENAFKIITQDYLTNGGATFNQSDATDLNGGGWTLSGGHGNESGSEGGGIFLDGGDGTQAGGSLGFTAGDGLSGGNGGTAALTGGNGGSTTGTGGAVLVSGGDAAGGNNNGGDIELRPGSKQGSGTAGNLKIYDPTTNFHGMQIFSSLSTNRTYTWPNATGTLALTSDLPVGANPTASVGLSAVNGSAVTFLRSDGAPALSQAITPTWTGAHIFGNSTSAITVGTGAAGIDYKISFNGESNDALLTYEEDEKRFNFDDDFIITEGNDPSVILKPDGGDSAFWFGVSDDEGNDDDDFLVFGTGEFPGVSTRMTLARTGNVSIGNIPPETSNGRFKLDGAARLARQADSFGTTSDFPSLVLDGDTFGTVVVAARATSSNEPFTVLGVYDDDSTERGIFYGGVGWGLPDALNHYFYAAPTYTETNDTAELIATINNTGVLAEKIIRQGGCPANFTRFGLGCIQTNEEGSGTWDAAREDCYDTHGGRLPTPIEAMAAWNNLTLTNETDDDEWLDGIDIGVGALYLDANAGTADEIADVKSQAASTSTAYRCFVPFSGGS